jgi:hypothetical protein
MSIDGSQLDRPLDRQERAVAFAIGGRQLRNRLFSTEEVYKTALKNELVQLGIPPSQASEAVNTLWKDWGKKDIPDGWKVYAVLWANNDKWIVALCSQKISGGPLYKHINLGNRNRRRRWNYQGRLSR